jgi:hypothetical protein
MKNVLITKTIINATAGAFADAAKLEGKAQDTRNMAVQKVVDHMLVKRGTQSTKDFLKGNASTNAARASIKELFESLVERGLIAKQSRRMFTPLAFGLHSRKTCPLQLTWQTRKARIKKNAPRKRATG